MLVSLGIDHVAQAGHDLSLRLLGNDPVVALLGGGLLQGLGTGLGDRAMLGDVVFLGLVADRLGGSGCRAREVDAGLGAGPLRSSSRCGQRDGRRDAVVERHLAVVLLGLMIVALLAQGEPADGVDDSHGAQRFAGPDLVGDFLDLVVAVAELAGLGGPALGHGGQAGDDRSAGLGIERPVLVELFQRGRLIGDGRAVGGRDGDGMSVSDWALQECSMMRLTRIQNDDQMILYEVRTEHSAAWPLWQPLGLDTVTIVGSGPFVPETCKKCSQGEFAGHADFAPILPKICIYPNLFCRTPRTNGASHTIIKA